MACSKNSTYVGKLMRLPALSYEKHASRHANKLATLEMIVRMNLRENGKPRNYAPSCDELLFQYRLDYSSGSSRWNSILRRMVVTATACTARNIIGYAALVVCLFAAYLRVPTIKSNRKTWMECRNDERQCISARLGRRFLSSSDTRAKS